MLVANVWKIGSRWGNQGRSVFDLFQEYGCVFVGSAYDGRIGDWTAVQKGDLFVISDGATPVAVAEAQEKFCDYKGSGLIFKPSDEAFILADDNAVVVCRAKIVLLNENERCEDWMIDTRKRFCSAHNATEKVHAYWIEHSRARERGVFDIKADVLSLFGRATEPKIIDEKIKYQIPIYQRPYSWGETEIRRLLEDINQGLIDDEPIFLGTMQLTQAAISDAKRGIRSHQVIDGQQRLSTFIILLSILERITKRELRVFEFACCNFTTSVNKRSAQIDFDNFKSFFDTFEPLGSRCAAVNVGNQYIGNAITIVGILKELAASKYVGDQERSATDAEVVAYSNAVYEFLERNVKIVVMETHAGLSKTLKIFNTINSAGLDLGSEDLFKVRFYEYRQSHGDSEEVFNRISEIYEKIDTYNRSPYCDCWISMSQILSTFQRSLIGRYGMNAETFSMSQERFFERLFDTTLHVHEWPEFRNFKGELVVEDLDRLVDCQIGYLKKCSEDPKLEIFRRMFWETRYGYADDFPVIALFSGVTDENTLRKFTIGLVKSIVPASIYFAKTVSHGRSCLLDLLKLLCNGSMDRTTSIVKFCNTNWKFYGRTLSEMVDAALDQEIAWTVKWKNLICKLVEYLNTNDKARNEKLTERLFFTSFDIEHIQSYTDEDDSDRVYNEWGGEINKIGNLSMFESSLNRSVQNHVSKKLAAYQASAYISIRGLADKVDKWSLQDAVARRKYITHMLKQFLATDDE